jgi:hypothetical protein
MVRLARRVPDQNALRTFAEDAVRGHSLRSKTGDYDSSSDIDVLTKGVERGVAQLLRTRQPAGRKTVAPKRTKSEAPNTRSTDKPPTPRA